MNSWNSTTTNNMGRDEVNQDKKSESYDQWFQQCLDDNWDPPAGDWANYVTYNGHFFTLQKDITVRYEDEVRVMDGRFGDLKPPRPTSYKKGQVHILDLEKYRTQINLMSGRSGETTEIY